jgi:hypothetical protein
MEERPVDADQTYDDLVERGFDNEVAGIVRDQLRVKQLETYSSEIQQLLEAKAQLVRTKAEELFRVLGQMAGLDHRFPTQIEIDHNGIRDKIDLVITVSSSDRGQNVRFVWKTHNLHVIDTLPEGFSLGDLNIGKRREHTVETQIPILAMNICPPASEKRGFFSEAEGELGEIEITFRLNRSWIEEKSSASDAQFDSIFESPVRFLDFLSDNAHNPVYSLLMRLISGVSEILSGYLSEKRRFIEGLDL